MTMKRRLPVNNPIIFNNPIILNRPNISPANSRRYSVALVFSHSQLHSSVVTGEKDLEEKFNEPEEVIEVVS